MFDHIPDNFVEISLQKNEIKFQSLSEKRRAMDSFINIALNKRVENFDFVVGPRSKDKLFVADILKKSPEAYLLSGKLQELVKNDVETIKQLIVSLVENNTKVKPNSFWYETLVESAVSDSLKKDSAFVSWWIDYVLSAENQHFSALTLPSVISYPAWKNLGYGNNRELLLKVFKAYPELLNTLNTPLYSDLDFVKQVYTFVESDFEKAKVNFAQNGSLPGSVESNLVFTNNKEIYKHKEIIEIVIELFKKNQEYFSLVSPQIYCLMDVLSKDFKKDKEIALKIIALCNDDCGLQTEAFKHFHFLLKNDADFGLQILNGAKISAFNDFYEHTGKYSRKGDFLITAMKRGYDVSFMLSSKDLENMETLKLASSFRNVCGFVGYKFLKENKKEIIQSIPKSIELYDDDFGNNQVVISLLESLDLTCISEDVANGILIHLNKKNIKVHSLKKKLVDDKKVDSIKFLLNALNKMR